MAFSKTLAQRLFKKTKITSLNSLHNCRTSSPSNTVKSLTSSSLDHVSHDPGDGGVFRRFLHRRAAYYKSPGTLFPEIWSFPSSEKLLEECRGMDIAKDRIRLDLLRPPEKEEVPAVEKLTVDDLRKLLMLSELEKVKMKLRRIEKSCISYDEFVKVCKTTSFGEDQCMEMVKMLDQSGTVIVLGNVVFLRPQQVMKAIKCLIPEQTPTQIDPKEIQQLEEMEKEKEKIDRKAESLVRKELWCGLGYLVIQTAAFFRLTFWELSWDVMEPICFYVTSMYFMAGYTFFLRTSKEPSFEGFFQARFVAKQRKLMKLRNFDMEKYGQLRKVCYGDAFRELDSSVSFGSRLDDIHDHVVR